MCIHVGADVVLANLSQGGKQEITFEDINNYCKNVKTILHEQEAGEASIFFHFAVNRRDLQDAVARYPDIFSKYREKFICENDKIHIENFNNRYNEELRPVLQQAAL